jgi:hypothetical protein
MTVRATVKSRDAEDLDRRAFSLCVLTAVMLSPTDWVNDLVLIRISERASRERRAYSVVEEVLNQRRVEKGRRTRGPNIRGQTPKH